MSTCLLKIALTPLLFIFLFTGQLASVSHAAGSATLQLSPTTKTVAAGSRFSVQLSLNPNGEAIDTARAQLSFNPSLLEATGFSLNGGLNNTSPGNYIDNGSGQLSGGGFTVGAPVTTNASFATVTFRAKATGTATIALQPSSRLISVGEEKINTAGLNSTTVIITAASDVPQPGQFQLESSTHPDQDQWYSLRQARFNWSPAQEVKWVYDSAPDTVPTKSLNGSELTIKRLKEGISYLHLQPTGGAVIHYQIKTDTKSPNRFEPFLEVGEDNQLFLRFATTDSGSGVERYQVKVNDQVGIVGTSPYLLSDLLVGENMVTITAFDFAQNQTEAWIKFQVNPDGSVREIAKSKTTCSLGGLPIYLAICCNWPAFCQYGIWIVLILILGLIYGLKRKA